MTAARESFPELADRAWRKCDEVVAHFEECWQSGQRPSIDDCLPVDAALRQAILIELVHTELEYRLQAGEAARVEEYLRRYPSLARDQSVLIDLIRAEAELRSEEPEFAADEYLERFPQHRKELAAKGFVAVPVLPVACHQLSSSQGGAQDGGMRVSLTVTGGPHKGRVFTFAGHDNFMVGRSFQTHFRLRDQDKQISRVHFMVEVNPPDCQLMDMGSRNGTYVNDCKVDTAMSLKDGDLIKAGRTTMRLSVQLSSRESPSPPAALPGPGSTIAYFGSSVPKVAALAHPVVSGTRAKRCLPPPAAGIERCLACSVKLSATEKTDPLQGMSMLCPACWEKLCQQPQTIPGYRLIAELGRGGLGVVYLALRSVDATPVALKTIVPAVSESRSAVPAFLREAHMLCGLNHPNIVGYRDVGEANGLLYFVMEYVPGADVGQLLEKHGPLPIDRAVALICPLLDALDHAHRKGFVHGDIKPANLLVTSGVGQLKNGGAETVKLADFGLARVYQASRLSGLTMTGDTGGAVEFMAPEQITHFRDAQPPADQYATAATLYNLISNRFVHDLPVSIPQRMLMILQDEPVPIQSRRPTIPKELARIIHRALARDPKKRFADVREMRQSLGPFT